MSNHEIGDSGFYDTNRRDFVNSMEEPVRESLAVHAAIVADHTPIVPELDQPIPIVNPADYFESNNQIGLSVVVKTVDPQSMRKDRYGTYLLMQTNITTQTIDKINGNFFTGEVIKLPDYILDVLTQHALAITDERTPVDLDALSKDINFTIQAAGIMETSDITVYHGYVDKQPVSLVLKRGSDENWSINYETNLQAGMWIASNGFMYRQDETTQDDSHLYADPIGRLSA